MSLQVWLPLNGNLNNQGLRESTITGTNVNHSDGKVTSKCLSFARTSVTTPVGVNISNFSLQDKETWSCWFKYDATATTSQDVSHAIMTIGTDWEGIVLYTSRLSVHNGHSIKKQILMPTVTQGVWYHVAVVIDKPSNQIALYVSGNLIGTSDLTGVDYSTFNTSVRGIGTLGSSTTWHILGGLINDVRIYNECLSLKQIKELSKGLCLHYKLSRGGENLLKGTAVTKSWSYSGTGTSDSNFNQETIIPAADSWYTMSFDVKSSVASNNAFQTYLYNNNSGRQCDKIIIYKNGIKIRETAHGDGYSEKLPVTTDWTHYEIVRHFDTNATALTKLNVFRIMGNSGAITLHIKNAKIEVGDHATSWIPNKSDSEYKKLGYNNIEPDCSGYGNNGTINGTLTYSNDTPRYEGSSVINGSVNYLYPIPDPIKSTTAEFTISLWFKTTAIANTQCLWNGRTTQGAAIAIFILNSGLRVDDSVNSAVEAGKLSSNTWYHVVVTWKSGSKKTVYINGVEKLNVNAGTLTKSNFYASIGRSSAADSVASANYFTGNISDVRIYATALSADDVKALYNNPISIDNNKNLHCKEFTETPGVSFGKNGVVKHPEANLISMNSKLGIKDIQED